jgi:beta-phosphoglucomutase-like phosphatase (HAD superfamily)
MFSGLVIFDCDGVLVDSEGLVNEVESGLLSELGIEVSPEQARALFKGKTVVENVLEVERMFGGPIPVDWSYRLAMSTALVFVTRLRSVPLVQEVLEVLEETGVPRCVASQSPLPRVELSLRITGLARYFGEHVYTASMVKRPKPAPDLFLHAAAALGFSAGESVVIEDSPTGVLAARAAGMRVFGYAGAGESQALSGAGAVVFESMRELRGLLDV